MPTSLNNLHEKVGNALDEYISDLEESEKLEVLHKKDEIVANLMAGKFRDLGGLTAMRGFVYQYYVSMYYMMSMISPTRESWWDAVVLEYFDDITLIGEEKIRFIQVKTIREGGDKNHQANNFYTRKSLDQVEDPKSHFNSWVEKNILNYDYFLESNTVEDITDKNSYEPQFEIVTNTKKSSLSSLKKYTENINYEITDSVSAEGEIEDAIKEDDVFKKAIQKPINKFDYSFEDYAQMDIDYYLKRLYINKLGSTRELYEDTLNMIEETVYVTDIRAKSIAEHIFNRMFSFVISNSHEDNEDKIKKSELIITKAQINYLIQGWLVEAKELISESSYYDSAWGIFETTIGSLETEFKEQFANGSLKAELLTQLDWLNNHITASNRENSTYCVSIFNKIFNGNNNLSIWDFEHGDIRSNLKESLRFIVYFTVFYESHSEVYHNAKMLFHEGKSSVIDNVLFTIYHARNKLNKVTSIEKIKSSLDECHVSRHITFDLYCLLIGSKKDVLNPLASKISAKFKITTDVDSLKKITEVPDHMKFVDVSELEDFFESFKQEGIELDSFKEIELLPSWKEYLDEIVEKMKVNYIEA
ncbi:dsDNA nuclease domain-containing protein [Peribacillus simplex]|uniref:dsDNA nuclease domain-containing protein n=2 Tax=Peribacillus simplex TaxID=1478 RepID=UPI002E23F806|nr:dsDNA nuclease domain-containing protein [Peribacillus simplex]MED3912762.1 dsDNA nuclease domain-containing protein [Peribacillus simplex]